MDIDSGEFPLFNLTGIIHDARNHAPTPRPSQKRAAEAYRPLIALAVSSNPTITTLAVREIIEANNSGDKLPENSQFKRAFASITNAERAAAKRKLQKSKSRTGSLKLEISTSSQSTPAARDMSVASIQREPTAASFPLTAEATGSYPLTLYAGKFTGKVFVLGTKFQRFFTAIEQRRDDVTMKSLATAVMSDAEAMLRLKELHPKDRAILDAALKLP